LQRNGEKHMHSLGKEVSTTCYEKWDRIFDVIDG
jgi:hypothetical protein